MVKQIELTRGLFALVDDEDFEKLNQYNWLACKARVAKGLFYAFRTNPNKKPKMIFMHNDMMNPEDGFIVDHLNGNGLDNRKINFRICTERENGYNKPSRGGSSIYKGVCFIKRTNMWLSQLRKDYKLVHRKEFKTEIEAALAYDEVARKLYGNTVRLNFPKDNELSSLDNIGGNAADLEKWNSHEIAKRESFNFKLSERRSDLSDDFNEFCDNTRISKITGKPVQKRGFAAMSIEKRTDLARKGGASVDPNNRSFSKNRDLAATAGRKGGFGRHKALADD